MENLQADWARFTAAVLSVCEDNETAFINEVKRRTKLPVQTSAIIHQLLHLVLLQPKQKYENSCSNDNLCHLQ
ncbi:MAG: hypothetical protein JO207_05710 [Verrucomicrobia bacterium]|nr:hypothetical protein [Verrucomicrobiota bacterium]MBV8533277.1 hypothetical protein [Verrucomicrobiota bacterium]